MRTFYNDVVRFIDSEDHKGLKDYLDRGQFLESNSFMELMGVARLLAMHRIASKTSWGADYLDKLNSRLDASMRFTVTGTVTHVREAS